MYDTADPKPAQWSVRKFSAIAFGRGTASPPGGSGRVEVGASPGAAPVSSNPSLDASERRGGSGAAPSALAALAGRDYVVPDDVQLLAVRVLAHRLLPTVEASMSGRTTEAALQQIVAGVAMPESRRSVT